MYKSSLCPPPPLSFPSSSRLPFYMVARFWVGLCTLHPLLLAVLSASTLAWLLIWESLISLALPALLCRWVDIYILQYIYLYTSIYIYRYYTARSAARPICLLSAGLWAVWATSFCTHIGLNPDLILLSTPQVVKRRRQQESKDLRDPKMCIAMGAMQLYDYTGMLHTGRIAIPLWRLPSREGGRYVFTWPFHQCTVLSLCCWLWPVVFFLLLQELSCFLHFTMRFALPLCRCR